MGIVLCCYPDLKDTENKMQQTYQLLLYILVLEVQKLAVKVRDVSTTWR